MHFMNASSPQARQLVVVYQCYFYFFSSIQMFSDVSRGLHIPDVDFAPEDNNEVKSQRQGRSGCERITTCSRPFGSQYALLLQEDT